VATKKSEPIVFVVDDDESVRSSLRFLLRSLGIESRSFASATEFLAAYDPAQPGCLVLDVRMPGMSGLELQQQLNLRGAVLPVIFVTGHGDIPMAVEAMQHGAHDFLQKPFRDQDLIDRIQRAVAKDAETRAALRERHRVRERLASLTPREREVLALLAQGKPNKIMAHELGLSQRTVEIHRARVMEKSGATSLAQLVRMVMDAEPQDGEAEPERLSLHGGRPGRWRSPTPWR
jgi:two-component system, LuxR family, response regulator FixJ